MPRRSSGPRLWFDQKRGTYTIVDGRKLSRTGCGPEDAKRAEEILGDYIASKHTIGDGPDPLIADVLSAYASEKLAGSRANPTSCTISGTWRGGGAPSASRTLAPRTARPMWRTVAPRYRLFRSTP